jgi:hypothetical protein
MGMYFNTPGTTDVNNAANFAFRNAAMTVFRTDAANWATTFSNLPSAGPHNPMGGTYNLVTAYLPDPIQPSARNAPARPHWNRWLSFFDTQPNSLSTVAGEIVATTVGKAISAAITTAKYSQVEFFVVPQNTTNTKISAVASDFKDSAGNWSKIITIYTTTYDQLK